MGFFPGMAGMPQHNAAQLFQQSEYQFLKQPLLLIEIVLILKKLTPQKNFFFFLQKYQFFFIIWWLTQAMRTVDDVQPESRVESTTRVIFFK